MKILHLNSYYIRTSLYRNLYDLQEKSGHVIKVFVPVLKEYEKPDYSLGEYTDVVPDFTKIDRYFFHIKNHKMYHDAKKLYCNYDCELVHAHTLFTNGYMAYKMKRDFNRDYIVAVRDTDVNDFFAKLIWLRGLGNRILRNAKKVVFLSEAYKELVIEKYVNKRIRKEIEDKSVVIPNGVKAFWMENRRTMPKNHDNKSKTINIICVGTIYRRKNIETVVEAAKVLKKRGYEVSLKIVGPVRDNDIYERIIKEDLVEYYPKQNEKELVNFYNDADIFILPSITETFGLVYAEAMTQGLPVIYTRGQGFDRQFPDGYAGYAVGCFDVEEIADKTIQVMSNYKQISQNCLDGCGKFDWRIINNNYNKLYDEVFLDHVSG